MVAALIALCVRGNLGQNCWIQRRYLERALMRLMRRLGVELSSSESSEVSIGPGYENVVVLPRLLVKPFGKDLRTVSSRFPQALALHPSRPHRTFVSRRLSVAVTDSWFLSFILLHLRLNEAHRMGSFRTYLQQILPR